MSEAITYAEAMSSVRDHDDLYARHWNECRQISEYEEENRKLKDLLSRSVKLLGVALFVHYQSENDALKIRQEADELLGGADDE
jgi:hypothetical protein